MALSVSIILHKPLAMTTLSAGSMKKTPEVFLPEGRQYENLFYENADVDHRAGGRLVFEGCRLHDNGWIFYFPSQSGKGEHGPVPGRFSRAHATLLSLLRLEAVSGHGGKFLRSLEP
jgi:hypothetical protein